MPFQSGAGLPLACILFPPARRVCALAYGALIAWTGLEPGTPGLLSGSTAAATDCGPGPSPEGARGPRCASGAGAPKRGALACLDGFVGRCAATTHGRETTGNASRNCSADHSGADAAIACRRIRRQSGPHRTDGYRWSIKQNPPVLAGGFARFPIVCDSVRTRSWCRSHGS